MLLEGKKQHSLRKETGRAVTESWPIFEPQQEDESIKLFVHPMYGKHFIQSLALLISVSVDTHMLFCMFECFVFCQQIFVILSCTNKDYLSLYLTCSTFCVWETLSTSPHLYLLYLVGRPWHLLRTPPPEGTFVPPPPPGPSSAAAVKRFTLGGARRTDSRRLSSPSVRTW